MMRPGDGGDVFCYGVCGGGHSDPSEREPGFLTREFDIIAQHGHVSGGLCRRAKSPGAGAQKGRPPAKGSSGHLTSQGSLVETGRTLDFALSGKGFFVVESPDGPLYTRHGIFVTNPNGQVVDTAGRFVAGMSGPVLVPASVDPAQVSVSSDGRIRAGQAQIGKFRIVEFAGQEDQLVPAGLNCFRAPTGVEPVDAADATIKQGYQEASNVKLVEELVHMIVVSRLYEANMKLLAVSRDNSSSTISVAMG
jgi:flagellar basal body rod protein FlgG